MRNLLPVRIPSNAMHLSEGLPWSHKTLKYGSLPVKSTSCMVVGIYTSKQHASRKESGRERGRAVLGFGLALFEEFFLNTYK